MTHACCAGCRIRFTPAASAYLTACPECGESPQTLGGLAEAVGYRLFRLEDAAPALPEAVEVSMPLPDSGLGDRSTAAPESRIASPEQSQGGAIQKAR